MLGQPQAASAQSTSGFTFGYDFVGVGDQSGGTGSTAEPAATYQGSYAFAFPVFDYSGGHLLAEYGIPQAWDKGFVPTDGQTAIFTSMSVGAPYNYIRVSQTYYPGEFSYTSDAPSYHIFVESGLVFTGSGIDNQSWESKQYLTAEGAGSLILFANHASAGDAYLSTFGTNSQIAFIGESDAEDAHINLASGTALIVSTSDGALTIGDLSGTGFVYADNEFGGAQTQVLSFGAAGSSFHEFDGNLRDNPTNGAILSLKKVSIGD